MSRDPRAGRSRSRWEGLAVPTLAWVVGASLVWVQWGQVRQGIWVDSDVYVLGGRAVLDGDGLYGWLSAEQLPFTYAPFAALAFVPLAVLPADAARFLLTAVSLAAYVVAVLVVGRRLRLALRVIAPMALLGLGLEPLLRNLLLGQVNLVLLALVVLDCLAVPPRWRGYLVGVAAGVKIVPGIFVLFFVFKRDWRAVRQAGLGFAVTVLVGWVVAPGSSASFWGGGFLGLGKFGADAVLASDNQSLLGAWLRLAGTTSAPTALELALVLLGVALGSLAAYRCLRRGGPDADPTALLSLGVGSLLGSPISWSHHWVWVVPLLLLLVARRQWLPLAVTTLLFWYPTFWALHPRELRELTFTLPERIVSAVYVLVGLACLAYLTLASTRPAPEAGQPGGAPSPPRATAVVRDAGEPFPALAQGPR